MEMTSPGSVFTLLRSYTTWYRVLEVGGASVVAVTAGSSEMPLSLSEEEQEGEWRGGGARGNTSLGSTACSTSSSSLSALS